MNRKVAILAAMAVGIAAFLLMPLGPAGEHSRTPAWRWMVALGGAGIAVLPRTRRSAEYCSEQFDRLAHRRRTFVAITISILAGSYFLLTAINQNRDFFPKTHDECSYAIAVQQMAIGRLWMPQHPLADFFDSFYLIVRPVYASMYFPGTAMLNVPGVWLHLPVWFIPLVIASVTICLSWLLLSEFTTPSMGLLSTLLLISLSWFRMLSITLMSQLPLLMLGLIVIWSGLRYRTAGGRRWLLLIGVAAGWAAITRPLDAICFALPVGIAILLHHRKSLQSLAIVLGWIVCGALPFLSIQFIANRGITGHFLRTPFEQYTAENYPGANYGFHSISSNQQIQSPIVQKRNYYEYWAKDYIDRHQISKIPGEWWKQRLPLMADVSLPARPILILLPVGIAACFQRRRPRGVPFHSLAPILGGEGRGEGAISTTERFGIAKQPVNPPKEPLTLTLSPEYGGEGMPTSKRSHTQLEIWMLAVVLPLFVTLYVGYAFFLEHYVLVVTPSVALLLALGVMQIRKAWPRLEAAVIGAVVAFCLTGTWELNHWDRSHGVIDQPFASYLLRSLHEQPDLNSIVLFTFNPAEKSIGLIAQEPVYNIDVAWPDNEPMIRAHDLGARNIELFRYYAARQPDRIVRIFDRATGKVQELGRVGDLVH